VSVKFDHKATGAFGSAFALFATTFVEVSVGAISVAALDVGSIMALLKTFRTVEHGACPFSISASLQVPNVAASCIPTKNQASLLFQNPSIVWLIVVTPCCFIATCVSVSVIACESETIQFIYVVLG
jgi:hypothetical protein